MRPLSDSFLVDCLSALLLILDEDASTIPEKFAQDLEVDQFITDQILEWFPGLKEIEIATELGRALLFSWKLRKGVAKKEIDLGVFMTEWKAKAGDRAESQCNLSLLEVRSFSTSQNAAKALAQGFFIQEKTNLLPIPPHTLPLEPAARFSHLFALRSKWKPEDMQPVSLFTLFQMKLTSALVLERHDYLYQRSREMGPQMRAQNERGHSNILGPSLIQNC